MYSFPTKEVLTEAARVAHVSLIFHNKSLHLISQPNKISFSLNVRCLSPVCRSNGAKSLKISSYLRLHRQKRRKFCEQISPSKAVFISCSGALQRVQVKNFALSIRACKGAETVEPIALYSCLGKKSLLPREAHWCLGFLCLSFNEQKSLLALVLGQIEIFSIVLTYFRC